MNKSEYILGHIRKWEDTSSEAIFTDLERAFLMMYRMKLSEEEMFNAWKYVSQKVPFIAFSLLKRFRDTGLVGDNKRLTELVWQTANQSTTSSAKYFADVLAMASLLEKDIEDDVKKDLSIRGDKQEICILACENIESLSGREKNVLNLFKLFYKYIEVEIVETALYKNGYQFSKYDIEPLVLEFISELLRDRSFVLAYLIKKMYSVSFLDVNISVEEMYECLTKCNDYNFFRGGLIYKEFILIDNEIQKLKKWYMDLAKIKTETAKDEIQGIRLLYLCQSLQISPYKPEDILREMQISLANMPNVEMNRKQYIREYRMAVNALISAKNIEWCKMFIEAMQRYNVDVYESEEGGRWSSSQNIRKHIGFCDEREILHKLYESVSSVESIVYVYMNSFLRGIVCFADFVRDMYKKYDSDLINEMQKYKIGGRVSFDKEKNIYYVNTITVIKGRNKFFTTQESAVVLSKLGVDENVNYFSCKLMSYNPDSEVFKFSILGFGEQRLDGIMRQLLLFEHDGIVSDEFVEALRKTNISLVEANSEEFIELCICILRAIVSCCNDREKLYETIKGVERVNFFSYHAKKNSGKERNISGIKPEQYRAIRKCWNRLCQSDLDVFDCFAVYRNTILRRMYGLSEFLEKFVENTDGFYSDFFASVGDFAGRVQIFANSERTTDNMALFVAPAEFKLTNKARENTNRKYDRYLMEIPLYGESATAVRKKNSIRKSMPIRFEIDGYDGKGLFLIKNIKFL